MSLATGFNTFWHWARAKRLDFMPIGLSVRFYVVPYWEVVAVMVTSVADGVGVGTVGEVIVVVAAESLKNK